MDDGDGVWAGLTGHSTGQDLDTISGKLSRQTHPNA